MLSSQNDSYSHSVQRLRLGTVLFLNTQILNFHDSATRTKVARNIALATPTYKYKRVGSTAMGANAKPMTEPPAAVKLNYGVVSIQ